MNKITTFLAIALLTIPTYLMAAQSRNLESVLLEAASAGQTDIVKSFLDNGANLEFKNELGATPLIFASAKGQKEVVALLLDRGANVNAKTTTGITPLMAAASGGYADIVKLLLAKGADVSAKDKEGRTALSMAEDSSESQVADLLKSAQKSSAPEKPRVASRGASQSRQRSADRSESSTADIESSSPMIDSGQANEGSAGGQAGGPVGGLLNDPVIGQLLSRIPGFQQSGPGNVAAIQNVDPGAQMQPPAQGGGAQNQLPPQGPNAPGNAPPGNVQGNAPAGGAQGNAPNQPPAKGADPNLVTTPFTAPGGLEGTKTFNRTTGETQISAKHKDPETGQVVEINTTTDKSGKLIRGTETMTLPDHGANKGGEEIIKAEVVDGQMRQTSITHVSPKGDSSTTTNLDPKTLAKTSEVRLHPSGSTSTMNYTGCDLNGNGCHLVSAVDKDPKTGKMTTTTYDKDGKVIGTQVSDIPKDAQQKAAAFKAGKKPKDVAGNKQEGVAGQKDLTGKKEQVKGDVLKQIGGKPSGDLNGGNAQNQGHAKAHDPNLVVTPYTDKDGFSGTKTFNPATGETQVTRTKRDPKTGEVIKVTEVTDKSGKFANSVITRSMPDSDPNNNGGRKIIKEEWGGINQLTKFSETHVSAKGDSSTTTNFDPKTLGQTSRGKTSEVTVRADGSTTTTNYNGACKSDSPQAKACIINSRVDTDPKTGKMTTTNFNEDGKVTGTKVTDIPKDQQRKAAMLKAKKNLTGNKEQGLQKNKLQGLAGQKGLTAGKDKDKVKDDVLKKIGDKPSGDAKVSTDKLKTLATDKIKTGVPDKLKTLGTDKINKSGVAKDKPNVHQGTATSKEKPKVRDFTTGQKEKSYTKSNDQSMGRTFQSQGAFKQKSQTQTTLPFKEKKKDWRGPAGSSSPFQRF